MQVESRVEQPDKWLEELADFVTMETVAGNEQGNAAALEYLQTQLLELGFEIEIKGRSGSTGGREEHEQPVLVASRLRSDEPVLVLYNHYDVEKISPAEDWQSEPFTLTERAGRLYGRGMADNKAVLLARLAVLRARLAAGQPLPNILWLIQGEEEVAAPLAHALFPAELAGMKTSVCLEETGYHREGVPLLFHQFDDSVSEAAAQELEASLNAVLFDGAATVERRTLSKFGPCPFVNNLPAGSHYVGFGPNDYQARIHSDNESMDKALLTEYFTTFTRFVEWLAGPQAQGA